MLFVRHDRSARRRCLTCAYLLPLLFVIACSGGSGHEPGSQDDGGVDDAGPVYDGACGESVCMPGTVCDADSGTCAPSCTSLTCRAGQRCELVGSRAECRPDCDAITCSAAETCDESQEAAVCVSRCGDRCGVGQRCVGTDADAACEDLGCSDLGCELPMVCAAASDGKGGHVCHDASCSSDLQCGDGEYCFGETGGTDYCKGALCTPGEQRCTADDLTVEECLSNGSGWFTRETCLTASCAEQDKQAFCPCSDDWSCPAFTTCEVARCEGTGVAPTCFVSVVPMENALPSQEFQWGTNAGAPADLSLDGAADKLGETHPFPQSIQVVNVPMVVNLTDDNEDGEVNELDYPEIVFLSYCGSNYQSNGLLRAIHGGGFDPDHNPLAGKDYFATTGADCDPAGGGCDPNDAASWLVWNEGEDGAPDSLNDAYAGGSNGCQSANDAFDSSSTLAVGNLDGDAAGYPEIVVLGEQNNGHEYVYIFDAKGHFVARSLENVSGDESGAPAIANLDGQGLPEIVVGPYAWSLKLDNGKLAFDKLFLAGSESSTNGKVDIGPVGCIADLDEDGRQEIIVGSAAYDFPDAASCATSPCMMTARWTAAVPNKKGYCAVADVWGADKGSRPHPVTNPLDGTAELVLVRSGKVYVVDGSDGSIIDSFPIAGVGGGPPNVDDFDGDSMPEVGTAGSSGYAVVDFQAADPLDGQAAGCPAWPNILDVDNPLTGVFESDRGPYPAADPANVGNAPRVVPTQPDGSAIRCAKDADCNAGLDPFVFACNESTGACVCLHNGWTRKTQDASSEATGSSVFDFNGDGAAEVIYNDECFFRIFDGINGRMYSRIPSESRTRTEYPVVADLDNDGNAEIVFGVSNESGFCNSQWDTTRSAFGDDYFDDATGAPWADNPYLGKYNAGLEVWGEPRDLWVSARRIWNQHSYHVTQVTEGGAIPTLETPSWSPSLRTARGFNSYRSNPPSRAGVAPDLQVVDVDVAASGGGCEMLGSAIEVSARIRNAGDLRVGADIKVAFLGTWGSTETALTDAAGQPLVTTLGSPLRPGAELLVRVTYDSAGKTPGGLPDAVTAIVDPDDVERECDDANDTDNQAKVAVATPDPAPDLRLSLDDVTGSCPNKTVAFTVYNDGGRAAADIQVRFYAGNPAAGGSVLTTTSVPGPLEPGQSVSATAAISVQRDVTLYASVDPDDTIMECSESNNEATYEDRLVCGVVLF